MKMLTVILSLFFLTISTGFSFNLHYCGGKVSSVSISVEKVGCCCIEKRASCCGDETISVKYDSKVFSAISTPEIKLPASFDLLFTTQLHITESISDTNNSNIIEWQLPPPNNKPLYISLVRLTLYG